MSKKVVEIKGVKMELDLRQAVRIDTIQVGTRVKVLKKEYSDYKVYHGTVIGFEPFQTLPTVIVAYAKLEYGDASIQFLYYNQESKEVEIVVANDDDILSLEKSDILTRMNTKIEQKRMEMEEIIAKRNYFKEHFKAYWKDVEEAVKDAIN